MSTNPLQLKAIEFAEPLVEQTTISQSSSAHCLRTFRRLGTWHLLRFDRMLDLPVSTEVLHAYLQDLATGGPNNLILNQMVRYKTKQSSRAYKIRTIKTELQMLSIVHIQREWPNPCASPIIKDFMRRLRQAHNTYQRPQPLRLDHLISMLETCGTSAIDVRDRALLLLAWSTGMRWWRELAEVTPSSFIRTEYGYRWPLPGRFTEAKWRNFSRATTVEGLAAKALESWIRQSCITSGPIFVSAPGRRGGHTPLSGGDMTRILTKRARMAGLAERFNSQSIRAGYHIEVMASLPSLAFKLAVWDSVSNVQPTVSDRVVPPPEATVFSESTAELLRSLDELLQLGNK